MYLAVFDYKKVLTNPSNCIICIITSNTNNANNANGKGVYAMNNLLIAKTMTISKDMLPFLVPLIIIQIGLYIYTLVHILTHDTYKRGSRLIWIIVATVGCEFIGPIIYFVFGKEDE